MTETSQTSFQGHERKKEKPTVKINVRIYVEGIKQPIASVLAPSTLTLEELKPEVRYVTHK